MGSASIAAHCRLGIVAGLLVTGCGLFADRGLEAPPRITGDEVLVLEGQEPTPWRVEVAPGDGGRWCGQGALADDPQALNDPCNQLVGPDGVGARDGFGVVNTNRDPTGQVLAWGTVTPEADRVVAVLADGTQVPAELAHGPLPFAVWATATSQPPVRYEAFGQDAHPIGTRRSG